MLPSRRSESVLPPPSSFAHSKQQYYLSQQCVSLSLFHPALPFDLKVNAAASAFSVSGLFLFYPFAGLLSGTCVCFNTREKVSLLLFVVFL